MIFQNIALLRRRAGLSQEALGERLGVTRQTVAKWENGESVPDVLHADRLAELFEVSLDELVHASAAEGGPPPKGKYLFGTVTVGDKGQIVIPVRARRSFGIRPGDDLVLVGDIERGLALLKADFFAEAAQRMQEGAL